MAFELANNPGLPTNTTVKSYRVERLGQFPNVTIEYAETVEGGTNAMGSPEQLKAGVGREWAITLTSGNPVPGGENQLALLAQLMGTASFMIAKSVIVALGLTATDQEIATAIAGVENLDSVLADLCEGLERDRRAGTLVIGAAGNPPAVTQV